MLKYKEKGSEGSERAVRAGLRQDLLWVGLLLPAWAVLGILVSQDRRAESSPGGGAGLLQTMPPGTVLWQGC